MKAIHLTAYGSPAQNLQMVEVAEPNPPIVGEALVLQRLREVTQVCFPKMTQAV